MGSRPSFSSPPLELDFSIDFNERLGLMLGVAYKEYLPKWSIQPHNVGESFKSNPENLYYKSLQIPVRIYFSYPISTTSFSFFASIGCVLDIPLYFNESFWEVDTSSYFERYSIEGQEYWMRYYYENHFFVKKINLLLETGAGCSYTLCSDWKFYITATYDMGFRTVAETDVHYSTLRPNNSPVTNRFTDRLLYKGDYWMLALGLKHTIHMSEKDRKKR